MEDAPFFPHPDLNRLEPMAVLEWTGKKKSQLHPWYPVVVTHNQRSNQHKRPLHNQRNHNQKERHRQRDIFKASMERHFPEPRLVLLESQQALRLAAEDLE